MKTNAQRTVFVGPGADGDISPTFQGEIHRSTYTEPDEPHEFESQLTKDLRAMALTVQEIDQVTVH